MGIISGKPSRDFTRALGMPRGSKGLLHMLNAIVLPRKRTYVSCFYCVFHFVFDKGLVKCKFGGT